MRELAGSRSGEAGQCWQSSVRAEVYARGSLMSSSTWERSSFFSSVLARELRLLWAPMYRVAYTGLVKLVGCGVKKITRWLRQKKWKDLVYCERSSILLIQIGSARINNKMFPSSVLKPWQTVVVCYVFCVWLFVSESLGTNHLPPTNQ